MVSSQHLSHRILTPPGPSSQGTALQPTSKEPGGVRPSVSLVPSGTEVAQRVLTSWLVRLSRCWKVRPIGWQQAAPVQGSAKAQQGRRGQEKMGRCIRWVRSTTFTEEYLLFQNPSLPNFRLSSNRAEIHYQNSERPCENRIHHVPLLAVHLFLSLTHT